MVNTVHVAGRVCIRSSNWMNIGWLDVGYSTDIHQNSRLYQWSVEIKQNMKSFNLLRASKVLAHLCNQPHPNWFTKQLRYFIETLFATDALICMWESHWQCFSANAISIVHDIIASTDTLIHFIFDGFSPKVNSLSKKTKSINYSTTFMHRKHSHTSCGQPHPDQLSTNLALPHETRFAPDTCLVCYSRWRVETFSKIDWTKSKYEYIWSRESVDPGQVGV
jgi:hypothetical protein